MINPWMDGHEFINSIPLLIDTLPLNLDIKKQDLDKSLSSLDKLDRAIKHKGYRKCLEPNNYFPLVAYVGEVLRQAICGYWELRVNRDNKDGRLEPSIISRDGECEFLYHLFFDLLYEGNKGYISVIVESAVRRLQNKQTQVEYNSSHSYRVIDLDSDTDNLEETDSYTMDVRVESLEGVSDPFPSIVYSRFHDWLIESILYYRSMGFFEKYAAWSENKFRTDVQQLLDEFIKSLDGDDLNVILWEFYPDYFGETYETAPKDLDFYILRWDTDRVWFSREAFAVASKKYLYTETLERWSEISRNSFTPEYKQEIWDYERVLIEFYLRDIKYSLIANPCEDPIDFGILKQINQAISPTDYQFEIIDGDNEVLLVFLLENEKIKMSQDRNISFSQLY